MAEFTIARGILKGYKGDDEHVVIPDGVRKIDKKVFLNQTKLRSVKLPETLTWIELEAFSGCTNLTDISIPSSVQRFGHNVFRNTPWLKNAGKFAVANGILLAYQGKEKDVVIPDGIVSILSRAFKGKKVKSVVIPKGVTILEKEVFKDHTELKHVALPEGLKQIAESAFENCSSLEDVVIPTSVDQIDRNAFENCSSLTNLVIPDGVQEIDFAFWGCSNLTDVVVPDSVTHMVAAFEHCSSLKNVRIPTGVESIGGTFEGCTSLTSIEIPESVTNMWDAFSGCINLQEITIPEGVTDIKGAFDDCRSLTNIVIPDKVTDIGYCTFRRCVGLTSIVLPESVTSIGQEAFRDCRGLKSIIIPESVTEIECDAFKGCSSLRSIRLPSSIEDIESLGFGPMVRIEGVTKWQWQSLACLPGWKCRDIDVEEYLESKDKEEGFTLFAPRGYSVFRGPAFIIDQLKQKLGEGEKTETFPGGIAQVTYSPNDSVMVDDSVLAAYPALRFACFDSDGGDPVVLYSESGDKGITQMAELAYVKDEGEHWTYEAHVLKPGKYRIFDMRSGYGEIEEYEFPFRGEWEDDTYIIEENGGCYLCSPV